MSESKPSELSPAWEKARLASVILATLAVPVVVAFIGSSFSKAQKHDELSARYVELAIGILRSEPADDTRALRSWAVSVVDHFSEVKLSDKVRNELLFRPFEKEAKQVRSLVEDVLRQAQAGASSPMPGAQASSPLPK